jgi:capsule polysaccharide export protein KpsE/RkpR
MDASIKQVVEKLQQEISKKQAELDRINNITKEQNDWEATLLRKVGDAKVLKKEIKRIRKQTQKALSDAYNKFSAAE